MTTPADLVVRLEEGGLERLADLVMDDLLSRPVNQGFSPSLAAASAHRLLQAAAAAPELTERVRVHVRQARAAALDVENTGVPLRKRIPPELVGAVRHLLSEPWVPDQALVERLIAHEAMTTLIQEVLQDVLVRFARKLRSLASESSRMTGLGRAPGFSQLRSIGSGVAAIVGAEVERHLEDRASEFVSSVLQSVMRDVARYVSDPKRARTLASWRLHGLDTALDADPHVWGNEIRKIDENRLVDAVSTAIKSLAARPSLEADLEKALSLGIERIGAVTLGEELARAGLLESWRAETKLHLVAQARPILQNPAFLVWLEELFSKTRTPESEDSGDGAESGI